MREHRMSKGETEHYTSFEEAAKAWKCKPVTKQTKDKSKLEVQRTKFGERHLCQACKKPMMFIGGNTMVCQNENCKGIRHEMKNDETGETRTWFTPSYDLLDNKGAEVANNIFAEL